MLGAGATFAGYRIEGVLGQGGMGTVYRARHPRLPRTVALKLLNREVSTDLEVVRRFEREADVVARLDHPGIVGVLDRGANDGHLWIAMQYLRGTDAAHWDAAAHSPATVTRLLGGTASALDYAHSRGILHRDVKPANIVIVPGDDFRDTYAVLTDFGIAGLTDSINTKITTTGTFTATLAYASPEQLSGEVVDHRSDQYSLACTLFTLLAGKQPYPGTNPGQVVMGHIAQPVPRITAARADLPAALDEVFEQAMAKQRDGRFATCAEFITTAVDVLGGRHTEAAGTPAAAPTPERGSPVARGVSTAERNFGIGWYAALIVFVLLFLITGAAALLLPDSNDQNSSGTQSWGDPRYLVSGSQTDTADGDGHAAQPASHRTVGIGRRSQAGGVGDSIGDRCHRGRVGPDMFGETWFTQVFEAEIQPVHRELFRAQQQITLSDRAQQRSEAEPTIT